MEHRLQVHALAYNIFNWFRRLALSANMRKQRIDTVRLKLLKIAAKVIHSVRYITFKLCSSCPYIRNGIIPGINLLLTYETSKTPLDMKVLESMI